MNYINLHKLIEKKEVIEFLKMIVQGIPAIYSGSYYQALRNCNSEEEAFGSC